MNVKKPGRSSEQERKAYFYLGEEYLTSEDHMERDVFCNSQSKRKLKNRTGAEKTKKRLVGMGKWEMPGKDFFLDSSVLEVT